MPYAAKDYGRLVGIEGFSETLLKNHFTLYQGYVTNTNRLLDILGAMLSEGKTGTPEYAELKRRLAQYLADPQTYPEVKEPAVDLIYLAAEDWATATNWQAEASGA